MIKYNWDISTDEVKRILEMHKIATKNLYLLKEQEQVVVGEKISVEEKDFKLDNQAFPAGIYSIEKLPDEGKQKLEKTLQDVATWVRSKPNIKFKIQIEVGESNVTNFDRERFPTTGDKNVDYTKEKKLPTGELAHLRGNSLRNYLINYFEGLIKSGFITQMPEIPEPITVQGKIPYTINVDKPDDPKYLNDQFINFIITASSEKKEDVYKCLVNLTIDVSYYKKGDGVLKCRGGHNCNNAKFDIYLDNIPLGTANLNNAGGPEDPQGDKDKGGDRTAKFVVTNEIVEKIVSNPSWNGQTLVLSTACVSNNCHTSVQEVKISNSEKQIYHGCVNPTSKRGDKKVKVLAILDRCGKPINIDKASDAEISTLADAIESKRTAEILQAFQTNGAFFPPGKARNLFSDESPGRLKSFKLQLVSVDPVENNVASINYKVLGDTRITLLNPTDNLTPITQSFAAGDTVKIKYPIVQADLNERKIRKYIEDTSITKIPNTNLYFTNVDIDKPYIPNFTVFKSSE